MISCSVAKKGLLGVLLSVLMLAPHCWAQTYPAPTATAGVSIVPGTDDTGLNGDDATAPITLPFAYTLYGTTYASANISTNGNIQFISDSNSLSADPLPMPGFGDAIFAYQSDLVTYDTDSGQGIFTSVSGTAPHRIFNIEWRTRFRSAGGGGGTPDNNFEIRLYEGRQRFDIIYGGLTSNGAATTVGVQHDGSDFTQYESGDAGTLSAGLRLTFAVDTAPPVTAPALSAASYANGFFRGPVTVTLNATDDISGVAGTFYRVDSGPLRTYAGPFAVSGDFGHLVTFYSLDNEGNAEGPAKSATFSIDSTPPATEITSRDVPGGREVTLADRDNFSGPGGTFYRVDSGPQQTYAGPFIVTGAYDHLVTAYSIDRAANAENPNKSLAFTLGPAPPAADTEAPVTAPSLSGVSYVNGFYRGGPVTVTLRASDNASGVAGTFYRVDSGALKTYAGPFAVAGDFGHLVTFYSTDRAGNAEGPAKSVTFTLDTTAPVTTLTSRAVSGGQEVTLAATDNFSGPEGTFYRVDSGELQVYSGPFTVAGAGNHLVTAYSIDRAGNAEETARSVSFTN